MKCQFCNCADSRVVDSRPTDDGNSIRRRRECSHCQKRFTTYETIETIPIIIIKKDSSREPFSREKLMNGLLRACEKRPVSIEQIVGVIDAVEARIEAGLEREIASSVVGEYTLEALKQVDEVAYVRFASVYLRFSDAADFVRVISEMQEKAENAENAVSEQDK